MSLLSEGFQLSFLFPYHTQQPLLFHLQPCQCVVQLGTTLRNRFLKSFSSQISLIIFKACRCQKISFQHQQFCSKCSDHFFALQDVVCFCQFCSCGFQISLEPVNLQLLLCIYGKLQETQKRHKSRQNYIIQQVQGHFFGNCQCFQYSKEKHNH